MLPLFPCHHRHLTLHGCAFRVTSAPLPARTHIQTWLPAPLPPLRPLLPFSSPRPFPRVGRTGRAGDKEGVAYTLLLGKKDSHFAGLLVNSLSLGGQEVPRDLHALAMNVSGED